MNLMGNIFIFFLLMALVSHNGAKAIGQGEIIR